MRTKCVKCSQSSNFNICDVCLPKIQEVLALLTQQIQQHKPSQFRDEPYLPEQLVVETVVPTAKILVGRVGIQFEYYGIPVAVTARQDKDCFTVLASI